MGSSPVRARNGRRITHVAHKWATLDGIKKLKGTGKFKEVLKWEG